MFKKSLKILALLVFSCETFAQSTNTLWYKQPAKHFEETLVLGNGKLGATVFGGVESDKILLNDATLWSGEPVNANMNSEAYKNVSAIREALKNEDYKLADQLQRKLQGKFSESYAPLGTMFIAPSAPDGGTVKYTNYYRELDISKAVSKVTYEINGVKYTREYFVSHPDQIMIVKLTSSQKGALTFDVKFNSLLKYKVSTPNQTLQANGYAPIKAEPNYRRVQNPIVFDENKGTRFTTLAKIKILVVQSYQPIAH